MWLSALRPPSLCLQLCGPAAAMLTCYQPKHQPPVDLQNRAAVACSQLSTRQAFSTSKWLKHCRDATNSVIRRTEDGHQTMHARHIHTDTHTHDTRRQTDPIILLADPRTPLSPPTLSLFLQNQRWTPRYTLVSILNHFTQKKRKEESEESGTILNPKKTAFHINSSALRWLYDRVIVKVWLHSHKVSVP